MLEPPLPDTHEHTHKHPLMQANVESYTCTHILPQEGGNVWEAFIEIQALNIAISTTIKDPNLIGPPSPLIT